jgi:hypothetical protein
MTTATVEELLAGIKEAGRGLSAACEGTGHLTCSEIQPMVDLLLLAGFRKLAENVVLGHALGDDDIDDVHHHIYMAAEGGIGPDADTLAAELIDAHLRGEPLRKFRVLLPGGAAHDFTTQDSRDDEARRLADTYGVPVLTESWDAEHPQDELNQGWACDAVVEPTPAKTTA